MRTTVPSPMYMITGVPRAGLCNTWRDDWCTWWPGRDDQLEEEIVGGHGAVVAIPHSLCVWPAASARWALSSGRRKQFSNLVAVPRGNCEAHMRTDLSDTSSSPFAVWIRSRKERVLDPGVRVEFDLGLGRFLGCLNGDSDAPGVPVQRVPNWVHR